MKQIYDWDARPATRNHTVADLQRLKGKRQLVQTTANTAEEAAAAADAGIDLIMGNAHNTGSVRQGASTLFFTAALGLPVFPTSENCGQRISVNDGYNSHILKYVPCSYEYCMRNIKLFLIIYLVPFMWYNVRETDYI